MISRIGELDDFYPRLEGSENEKKVFEYIETYLKAYDIKFTRSSFAEFDGIHSFSGIISAQVSGNRKDTLLITVPVNHPVDASRDSCGSVNIVLGLEILRMAREEKRPLSLQVNFMGAEFGTSGDYPLGSRLFLENWFPADPVIQLYFNMRQIPRRILIRGGTNRIVAPYWLITGATNSFRECDLFFLLRGNENQLYRFGLNTQESIITPYLQREIPSLAFEGLYGSLTFAEKRNWLTSFIKLQPSFAAQFTEGVPKEWDKHYLFFQAKDFYVVINENLFLLAFLGVISLALIYILVFTRIFRNVIRLFFRYIWILPVFTGTIFLLNWLSGLIIQMIGYFKGIPDIWMTNPLLFLILKFAFILVFFLLTMQAISPLKFTRNFIFYISAGIITLFFNIIIVSVIDISFSYYFLWAFIFFLFSNISRSSLMKFLFFLPSTYWIVKSTLEIFLLYQSLFTRIILLSSPLESLVIALILNPFILMAMGIFQKRKLKGELKSHTQARNLTLVMTSLIILGITIYIILTPAYNTEHPQAVYATQEIDRDKNTNNITIESPGLLGPSSLWVDNELYSFDIKAPRYILPITQEQELFTAALNQVAFLDRKNITLTLTARGTPSKISLFVSTDSEFTLFDSNFPFIRHGKGTRYEILMGAYPPMPLKIELTLPAGYYFDFQLHLKYDSFPYRFELGSPAKKLHPLLEVKKTLKVET